MHAHTSYRFSKAAYGDSLPNTGGAIGALLPLSLLLFLEAREVVGDVMSGLGERASCSVAPVSKAASAKLRLTKGQKEENEKKRERGGITEKEVLVE